MTKAIIIDWHGVIDRKTFNGFVKLVSKETNKDFGQVKNLMQRVSDRSIGGEVESSVAWQEVKDLFNLSDGQIRKLKEYILTIDLNEGVVNFLETMKNRYQIILLSDCPKDKAEIIQQSNVATLFKRMYFSCYIHKTKRDSEFFTDISKELALSPEECLYIDDNEGPIQKADSLGFKTYLFKEGANLNQIF